MHEAVTSILGVCIFGPIEYMSVVTNILVQIEYNSVPHISCTWVRQECELQLQGAQLRLPVPTKPCSFYRLSVVRLLLIPHYRTLP